MIYLTGFADEAASDIEGQIMATKRLGWENIEARNIDGKNIHDLSAAEFDIVYGKLQDAGIKINCFGSAIANWSKNITEPFDSSLAEARRAIPRMKKLGTKLIRIMSFAVLPGRELDDQMEEERFKRLRELHKMFTGEGLIPVHENCINYGGMGWTYTLRLIEHIPGLKLVFDTGNPVFADDRTKEPPYPKQSSWEFYAHVKEHIAYIHVKDGRFIREKTNSMFPENVFTWPGEGDGEVRRIIKDLLDSGYDGGLSIEPHMVVVFHDKETRTEKKVEKKRFANYIKYGHCLEKILEEIKLL